MICTIEKRTGGAAQSTLNSGITIKSLFNYVGHFPLSLEVSMKCGNVLLKQSYSNTFVAEFLGQI